MTNNFFEKRDNMVLGVAGIGLAAVAGTAIYLNIRENNRLREQLDQMTQEATVKIENTLCDSLPEKFYVINGDTAYVTVEGMKIKDYFAKTR